MPQMPGEPLSVWLVVAVGRRRDHLAMKRDHRKQRVLWWRVAVDYAWSIVARELAASPRWSPRTKLKVGLLAGVAISFPVTFGTWVPYVYWLLTGRGPWQRYGFSSAVVVNPFPRRMPAELQAALAELQNERSDAACPVASRASA